MKLELSFGSFKDLKEQLQIMIDELSITETKQYELDAIYGKAESKQFDLDATPISISTDEVAAQSEPVVETPKKRTRRTKEQIEAEKTKPVETAPVVAPVVEQPMLSVTVENMVNVLSDMVAENPSIPLAPKNFYSLSEFSVNFAIVLNTLLNDGSLNIGDLETACKYYDVKNIYLISKDIAMMEHYYNDLVSRQIITKKGDY